MKVEKISDLVAGGTELVSAGVLIVLGVAIARQTLEPGQGTLLGYFMSATIETAGLFYLFLGASTIKGAFSYDQSSRSPR